MVMTKDYMTLKGIGKKRGESLYRDWRNDNDEGILYYEDKKNGFLIRQILPIEQDLQLIKFLRRNNSTQKFVFLKKQKDGKLVFSKGSELIKEISDKEILEHIKRANPLNNNIGSISVAVFNINTKEFITMLDIEPIKKGEYEEGIIAFTFSGNLLKKKRYEPKLKRWINELLIEKMVYPKGCKELVYYPNGQKIVPIL